MMANRYIRNPSTGNMVLAVVFEDRIRFWDWCKDNGISVAHDGHPDFGYDAWFIEDDQQLALAMLRWTS